MNYFLIGITVLTFLLFQRAGQSEAVGAASISFGLIPAVFFDIRDLAPQLQVLPEWTSIFTYAFLHGDFVHLIGNMVFLWVFGDNVEDALGHIKYLIFYLLCAAGGGIFHAMFDFNSTAPLIGASGAVSGIVVAYLMLHPKVKVWGLVLGKLPLRLPALWLLGAWVLFQFYSAVADSDGQIAWNAHIGGMLAGAILVVFLRRRGVDLFDKGLG